MQLQLGSIVMNNNTADSNGTLWYLQDLVGWDSPAHRINSLSVPTRHGEVTTSNLYGAREMTIKGLAKCNSLNNFYETKYYLAAQTNALVTPITLTVTEGSTARQMAVVRNAPVRMMEGLLNFTFEINVKADDPFKYSTTLHTQALVTDTPVNVTNAGSVLTYPIISQTDAVTHNLQLNNLTTGNGVTGHGHWASNYVEPNGTVVDMKHYTMVDGSGGNLFQDVHPDSDWWWLEPGVNSVKSNHDGVISWRDAWV